jgi:hypothetical protein
MARATLLVIALATALLALGGPPTAFAAPGSANHTLRVEVAEWAVVPSGGHVHAGALRITVANAGVLPHELAVVPTARWGQKLRVRDGRALGKRLARPVVVKPGQTRSVSVDLAPGSYVLLDTIRGHYALGAAVSIVAS